MEVEGRDHATGHLLLLLYFAALLCFSSRCHAADSLPCFVSTFHFKLHFGDALNLLIVMGTSRDQALTGSEIGKIHRGMRPTRATRLQLL